jgi:hypothetical protein
MLIYQRVTYTYNDAGESKRMKSTRVDYLPSQFEGHMVAAFENIFKNINHDKISLCNRIVCWHSFLIMVPVTCPRTGFRRTLAAPVSELFFSDLLAVS